MAEYTPYYNLMKPEDAEYFSRLHQNGNMDLIDAALHALTVFGNTKSAGDFEESLRNLETITGGKFLLCDGRVVLVTSYPDLAALLPYNPEGSVNLSKSDGVDPGSYYPNFVKTGNWVIVYTTYDAYYVFSLASSAWTSKSDSTRSFGVVVTRVGYGACMNGSSQYTAYIAGINGTDPAAIYQSWATGQMSTIPHFGKWVQRADLAVCFCNNANNIKVAKYTNIVDSTYATIGTEVTVGATDSSCRVQDFDAYGTYYAVAMSRGYLAYSFNGGTSYNLYSLKDTAKAVYGCAFIDADTAYFVGSAGKIFQVDYTGTGVTLTDISATFGLTEDIYFVTYQLSKIWIQTSGGIYYASAIGGSFTKVAGSTGATTRVREVLTYNSTKLVFIGLKQVTVVDTATYSTVVNLDLTDVCYSWMLANYPTYATDNNSVECHTCVISGNTLKIFVWNKCATSSTYYREQVVSFDLTALKIKLPTGTNKYIKSTNS